MADISIRDINVGQVLIKNGIKYIVIEKEINTDGYYDYLILTKLKEFNINNEINSNYIHSIYVGEDWGTKLEDFIITNEKYGISKIYRIYQEKF